MLVKKVLHENEARNSGSVGNACQKRTVDECWLKFKRFFCMEPLEMLVVKLSLKKTARNGDKMSMSIDELNAIFASRICAKFVPEIFYQEGLYGVLRQKNYRTKTLFGT